MKEFMLKEYKPKSVIGLIWLTQIVVYLFAAFLIHSLISGLVIAVSTALSVIVTAHVTMNEKDKKMTTPLNVLQYLENGVIDVVQMAKVVVQDIRRYSRPLAFFIILYAANSGLASVVINLFGESISSGMKIAILDSLHLVYNTALAVGSVCVAIYFVYVFAKIFITRHLSDWDEKLAKVMSLLDEEGIKVTYFHTKDGRCSLDLKQILNILVRRKVQTESSRELYWMIKHNYEMLSNLEFYPLGKPKTAVQILSERLTQDSETSSAMSK
jgi:hypothetical protein